MLWILLKLDISIHFDTNKLICWKWPRYRYMSSVRERLIKDAKSGLETYLNTSFRYSAYSCWEYRGMMLCIYVHMVTWTDISHKFAFAIANNSDTKKHFPRRYTSPKQIALLHRVLHTISGIGQSLLWPQFSNFASLASRNGYWDR